MTQTKLTPTEKKRKRLLGDIFLGLSNGNFGSFLPGWHDHGSISAIDVNTGKQVWKFQTPEPERGGVSTTDSGLGFAGGGDGVLRAFDLKNGKVLWTFQTGHQIAAGPAIYSVDGKQYIAITSGGTPTSSNGGIASELQIFAIGGSKTESKPPLRTLANVARAGRPGDAESRARLRVARVVSRGASGAGRMSMQTRARRPAVEGELEQHARRRRPRVLRVAPGRGRARARRRLHDPAGDGEGRQLRLPGRHHGRAPARRDASPVPRTRRSAGTRCRRRSSRRSLGTQAGFNVGYAIDGLKAQRQSNGTVLVTGRVHDSAGGAPPPVVLYTYQLSGIVTDPAGKPVQGAIVVTRTADRDFWTFSSPSDAQGHYTSFFSASDEQGADPVPLAVQVAVGPVSYGGANGTNFNFKRLHSSSVNIQLRTRRRSRCPITTPASYTGAVYAGSRRRRHGRRPRRQAAVRDAGPTRTARSRWCCPRRCAARRCTSGRTGASSSRASRPRPGRRSTSRPGRAASATRCRPASRSSPCPLAGATIGGVGRTRCSCRA